MGTEASMTGIASPATSNRTLAAIAEEVARSMASSIAIAGAHFIRTPLRYPSGTSVIIRIDGSADRYFASDNGAGYEEVLMLNAARGYVLVANGLTQGTGVGFDSRRFFVAQAASDELVGVVGAIANLSCRAVIQTITNHEARKANTDRNLLIERLESAFGRPRVERDVVVRGASTVEWEVIARVANDNVISVYDYASPHKNSVTSAAAKFHDIARLEVAPRRIVAVRDRLIMGNLLTLLSQAANVIELERATDDTLRRLAA
jgi:hypothetical protein